MTKKSSRSQFAAVSDYSHRQGKPYLLFVTEKNSFAYIEFFLLGMYKLGLFAANNRKVITPD